MIKIHFFNYGDDQEYECDECHCQARRIFKVFYKDGEKRLCPECFYDEILYPTEPVKINFDSIHPWVRDNDIAMANNNNADGLAPGIDHVF